MDSEAILMWTDEYTSEFENTKFLANGRTMANRIVSELLRGTYEG